MLSLLGCASSTPALARRNGEFLLMRRSPIVVVHETIALTPCSTGSSSARYVPWSSINSAVVMRTSGEKFGELYARSVTLSESCTLIRWSHDLATRISFTHEGKGCAEQAIYTRMCSLHARMQRSS